MSMFLWICFGDDTFLVLGEIYWTDTSEDLIRKATPDGRSIQNVIVDGLETADGLVVDSTGRKVLLFIYVLKLFFKHGMNITVKS
jgi:hypothetical protein